MGMGRGRLGRGGEERRGKGGGQKLGMTGIYN
jgi:hypothetical protein